MISLATPPFFIFSLLKRQMDKVYCKVGSALGEAAHEERREREKRLCARNEARRRTRADTRARGDAGDPYAVGEAAGSPPCPVTIIKDSPRRARRKNEDAPAERRKQESGECFANYPIPASRG